MVRAGQGMGWMWSAVVLFRMRIGCSFFRSRGGLVAPVLRRIVPASLEREGSGSHLASVVGRVRSGVQSCCVERHTLCASTKSCIYISPTANVASEACSGFVSSQPFCRVCENYQIQLNPTTSRLYYIIV